MRRWLILGVIASLVWVGQGVQAQSNVSPTPVQVQIPNAAPGGVEQSEATMTPTRTPTPVGPVLLEAITEANVRAEADLESEKLGTIRAGDTYPILGRYFRWLQFQYDKSPNGTAWVFDELVTIVGDETTIPDLNVNALPTVDVAAVNATGTWEAITLTPGGLLTATAQARVLPAPGSNLSSPGQGGDNGVALPQVLPTFTWPPDLAAVGQTVTPVSGSGESLVTVTPSAGNISNPLGDGMPPIAPILLLGGLGVLGLLIASIRR
ncbi:MAG: SH3 domain-containing protein [Anaerolineaceae bacterium]|nr:SH3 domain-containing protein [Anaerolineaceae bacterium]